MMFEGVYRWVIRISIALAAFFFGWGIIFYSRLPNRIPIQFGFDGSVNNFGSKPAVFLFPMLLLLVALIGRSNYIDMKYSTASGQNHLHKIIMCGCLILICGVGMYLFLLYAQMLK
ncbi:MAG: DUF1648 domain-containing protein [Enterococcus malodoratus]|uniref:DUF1648 domain-containing protein n=1 Tax=Enterococcus malodoratus TaxID=71451 RepID=UPI002072F867|nr:DUF1648 domain-containing protein [Enterococcus malodoratus]